MSFDGKEYKGAVLTKEFLATLVDKVRNQQQGPPSDRLDLLDTNRRRKERNKRKARERKAK